MSEQEKSEIIKTIVPVNSRINHNLAQPRAETTGHFWRMKEYKRRQMQNSIDIGEFIG